jgi:hypothetical protein
MMRVAQSELELLGSASIWPSWPRVPRTICFADGAAEPVAEPTSPVAEPTAGSATPQEPPAPDPSGDGAPAPVEPESKPVPELTAEQKTIQALERRIGTLTAKLSEAKAKPVDPGLAPPSGQLTFKSQAEYDAAVASEANRRAAEAAWNAECERVADEGKKAFPDFEANVNSILRLVDRNSPSEWNNYNQFLSLAIETGKGAEIIHKLGTDLNEAQRILGLPPTKMAVEVTKMGLAPVPDTAISGAPKPLTPVGARGAQHSTIDPTDPGKADQLSTAEWMRRREKQVAEQARH